MRITKLLLLGTALLGMQSLAAETPSVYTQSYAILIKGSIAGNEKVTEKVNEAGNVVSVSDHDILITDGLGTKRMAFSTKMELAKNSFAPISYSYRYTTGDSGDYYEVSVTGTHIDRTLVRNGHTSQATAELKPNTVILDFNVYHQYDYLVRQYDDSKGGRQVFSDFVPLIGSDIQVALTSMGESELKFGKGSIPVRNYRIEFVDIATGIFSVDKSKRLVRLVIPNQDLEVLRQDLLPGNPNPEPETQSAK